MQIQHPLERLARSSQTDALNLKKVHTDGKKEKRNRMKKMSFVLLPHRTSLNSAKTERIGRLKRGHSFVSPANTSKYRHELRVFAKRRMTHIKQAITALWSLWLTWPL